MMIVFVNQDKALRESFMETFHQTSKVFCFGDMFEAYKWIRRHDKSPDVIITEVDLQDPSGLQTLKFLETKSKLKATKLIAFTPEPAAKEEISLVVSEGADAVFSTSTLLKDVSSYLKFLDSNSTSNKGGTKKSMDKE